MTIHIIIIIKCQLSYQNASYQDWKVMFLGKKSSTESCLCIYLFIYVHD